MKDQLYDYYFQPIVNIQTMTHFGYESLLRIDDFCPESIFSAARTYNYLFDFDMGSIEDAIDRFTNMKKHRKSTYLFINVFPSTIIDQRFVRYFLNSLQTARLSPKQTVLEINESEKIKDYTTLESSLDQLKHLGVSIALDDIDKGIASLQNIVKLEPDYIKIDKYFADHLERSATKQSMIYNILNFCEENNICTVLEGIETDESLEIARQLGFDYGQGYLFGQPDHLND